MTGGHWNWLIDWCVIRARVTGKRQRIYCCRIAGEWKYWSTAASAGYGLGDGSDVRREMERSDG
jgi:hypothetical protein